MDGWMDGWLDVSMYEWKYVVRMSEGVNSSAYNSGI